MRLCDLKIEFMRGRGPGGQHRNKTDSACRITHLPSGIQAYADERSQAHSRKRAMHELELRIEDAKALKAAADRKKRRDEKIKPKKHVRTYNYSRQTVKDHRTGKTASIRDVMEKGRIDLLR